MRQGWCGEMRGLGSLGRLARRHFLNWMSTPQFALGQPASRPVLLTAWRSRAVEAGIEVGFTGLPDRVTHRLPCRASWEAFATEQGHWQIAAMHWVLGVTFREERTRSAEHSLASNRSWLQRFAITRLRRHSRKDITKGKLQDCMSNTNFLWEVLAHQGPVHALALGSTRLSPPTFAAAASSESNCYEFPIGARPQPG